ncbi:hypothetical protein R1sor_017004 [Riccia sorocarpa]|uniref:Protein kinase domain-containing protein n=1 Tax=Riccia sorocarpa TaxID=122646 RepID=A0ABD3I9J8_9MARC
MFSVVGMATGIRKILILELGGASGKNPFVVAPGCCWWFDFRVYPFIPAIWPRNWFKMRFALCREDALQIACEALSKGLLIEKCGPASTAELINPERAAKLRVFELEELETATSRFSRRNYLGKGSHGSLYKGILKDGKSVSVKRQEYIQDEIAFNNELEILSTLQGHRYVNLVGYCRGPDVHEKLLVVEYMSNGSLHDVLHHGPEPLSWSTRVNIALQVAKAVLGLHSANPAIIHRDVKSANIMFDSKWNIKLGSFGLAYKGNPEELARTGDGQLHPVGIMGYIEAGNHPGSARLSTKLDVFSFGILLLELLSGRKPIDVRHKPPSIVDWALPLIKQGKAHCLYDCRLEFQPQYAEALRAVAAIAARCVRRTSLKRPSMLYIVAGLMEVSKKIPMPKWTGFATAMKRNVSWQLKHGNEITRSPEFQDMMRSPRDRTRSFGGNYAASPLGGAEKVLEYHSSPINKTLVDRVTLGQSCGNFFSSKPQPQEQQQKARYGGSTFSIPLDEVRMSSIDRVREWALSIENPRPNARVHAMDSPFSGPLHSVDRSPVDNFHYDRADSRRKRHEMASSMESPQEDAGPSPKQSPAWDIASPREKARPTYVIERHTRENGRAASSGDRLVKYGGESSHSKAKEMEERDDGMDEAWHEEVLDVSLDNGKRRVNQWRSPVYDVGRSPEEVLSYLTDLSIRVNHRPKPETGVIPSVNTDDESRAGNMDPTYIPQASKLRSRSVRASSRNSHSKTRAHYEKEEAYLPW